MNWTGDFCHVFRIEKCDLEPSGTLVSALQKQLVLPKTGRIQKFYIIQTQIKY